MREHPLEDMTVEGIDMNQLQEMTVRVNTVPMEFCAEPVYFDCMKEVFPGKDVARYPAKAVRPLYFKPPSSALQHNNNIVEFELPPIAGPLEWAEFLVRPPESDH